MEKIVPLRDGTEVLVREMAPDDVDLSLAFFRGLPEGDRQYLRTDVTRRDVVEKRVRMMAAGRVERLVAEADGRIVADGSLELSAEEWTAHVGELRLVVARDYQRKGLGTLMARELYLRAASHKVEQIIVTMAKPQVGAQKIFRRLGFRKAATLPGHVKDRSGSQHDLVMMRCDLDTLWRKMESLFAESDWRPPE